MLSLPFSGRFCLTNFLSASPVHLNCFNDQRVRGLEGVLCQMDDVLIFGSDKAQHDQKLTAVLKRLQATRVTLNSEKCEFVKIHVKFLGHVIDPTQRRFLRLSRLQCLTTSPSYIISSGWLINWANYLPVYRS